MASANVNSGPARCAARRQKLLDRLGDGLLVIPTAPEVIRNGDVHHSFRPGSDLYYLSEFPEPEAVLVAWRTGKGRHRSGLFVRPKDKLRETWDGRRFGVAGAKREFGVDDAWPLAEFDARLDELLAPHGRVFVSVGDDERLDQQLFAAFARRRAKTRRSNPAAHPTLVDPRPSIAELRWIKDSHEIELMQRAADVSAEAHRLAMQAARPGMTEYQVQAVLEGVFRDHGSRRNGYDSIVASGANACILHYTENDRRTRRGDLMLLDAGAEIGHYTADITRTWPVDGAFTPAQKAVYEVVLAAQKAAVRSVRPGQPWDAPHKASLRWITKGLVGLGILRGNLKKLVDKGACRKWFMHGTSHWLGLDVHDVGPYQDADGKPVRMRPGMVLTVEPGLYFDPRDRSVAKEFRGIGVRIEDDVLVTRGGNRVLTEGVPKDVSAVEQLCRTTAEIGVG